MKKFTITVEEIRVRDIEIEAVKADFHAELQKLDLRKRSL